MHTKTKYNILFRSPYQLFLSPLFGTFGASYFEIGFQLICLRAIYLVLRNDHDESYMYTSYEVLFCLSYVLNGINRDSWTIPHFASCPTLSRCFWSLFECFRLRLGKKGVGQYSWHCLNFTYHYVGLHRQFVIAPIHTHIYTYFYS